MLVHLMLPYMELKKKSEGVEIVSKRQMDLRNLPRFRAISWNLLTHLTLSNKHACIIVEQFSRYITHQRSSILYSSKDNAIKDDAMNITRIKNFLYVIFSVRLSYEYYSKLLSAPDLREKRTQYGDGRLKVVFFWCSQISEKLIFA